MSTYDLENITRTLQLMREEPEWALARVLRAADLESEIIGLRESRRGGGSTHSAIAQTLRLMDTQEYDLNDAGPWGAGYKQALDDLRRNLRLRFGPVE